jgi:hypothetical protein
MYIKVNQDANSNIGQESHFPNSHIDPAQQF